MRVRQLRLSDMRSYASLTLDFDGRPVAISGPNGAGKTNILEALSLLGPGRGLRGAQLWEIARRDGQGGWAVAAVLEGAGQSCRLGTGIEPGTERRAFRLEGMPAAGPHALAEKYPLLWLTPAQDRLFNEPASARRRFLDRLVLVFDPAHAARLAAYEHAMRERTRLLTGETAADPQWLNVLERQMAEHGVAIAAARVEAVSRLSRFSLRAAANELFPRALLALDGTLETALSVNAAVALEDAFAETLSENRLRDGKAGRSLAGPHLSDLIVRHEVSGLEAHSCSTGEQKTLLIGLVLASAWLNREETGRVPVLLLDEIAAHLDARHRAGLFEEIQDLDAQAFMTGTDAHLFEVLGARAQHFCAVGGSWREEEIESPERRKIR
jgi:DNA replication and repair protein RecF